MNTDTQNKRLKSYKNAIATFYFTKTDRKFDEDFPNVQEFVLKHNPKGFIDSENTHFTASEKTSWNSFSDFTKKTEDFTEKDLRTYLEHFYEEISINSLKCRMDDLG